jgi:hypothetical protein
VGYLAQQVDKDVKALNSHLDLAQKCLEIANENGLLINDSKAYEQIIGDITEARRSLSKSPPDVIEGGRKSSLAYFQFNRAVNSMGFLWRFKYCLGGPVLLYLFGVSASVFLLWGYFSSVILDYVVLWIPSWAFLWGVVGGTLQGFWFLWQHISRRELRKPWFVWYVILPLMGALLGALTYLIFISGFIVATGETQVTSESFVMLLCALAGFSSKWAVELLDRLTQVIQVAKK